MATGPVTNLALAVRLDPTFPQKLKGLYIMGGNTECKNFISYQHLTAGTLTSDTSLYSTVIPGGSVSDTISSHLQG